MFFPNSSQYDLSQQLKACQSVRRRRGKVARLPVELRDRINRMLDDGVPYKTIIQSLGEAGKHLNEDNITNWRQGGFQDYVKAQLIKERAQSQIEAAADLVRDTPELQSPRLREALSQIALLSYMDTLMDHGHQLSRQALQKNPAKMITLMNSVCTMATTARQMAKLKHLTQPGPAPADSTISPSPSEVNRR